MSASFMAFNISHQEAAPMKHVALYHLLSLELIKETRLGTIRDLHVDDISSPGDGICFCILQPPPCVLTDTERFCFYIVPQL